MFPCSRVCCPCCFGYSRVDGSDETDGMELQENGANTTETDSITIEVPSDNEDEVDGQAAAYTDSAFRGTVSSREAVGLTSMGYSLLRICDYCQLFLQGLSDNNESTLNRARRSVESANSTHPSQELLCDVNRTSLNQTVPQWIYPCGITPNGTFPNGRRPFSILNTHTWEFEPLRSMDYGYYFRGAFDEWSHSVTRGGRLLRADLVDHREGYRVLPYGFTGSGDMIFRHFGNRTPQYPYASLGISNNAFYNGSTYDCPIRIFNTTHFFGGGYVGLEDPGFEPIYPCGIHPNGWFSGQWLGFPNGSFPEGGVYPFGYFPNGTFPYVDYFFNPHFDHARLYLALQNNQTDVLSNFTHFLNPNETRFHYHPLPTNYTEPFASCYGVYPPNAFGNNNYRNNATDYSTYEAYSTEIDRNIIQVGLWSAQFGAEAAMFFAQNSSYAQRRIVQALYLGTRTANIIHSAIDLLTNASHIMQYGPTNGEGERAVRNMLTLTDALNLANEAIYFCTPAIQRIQEHVTTGSAATYFTGLCSSLRGAGRIVRGALGRLTAITGAVGVACTAAMGAALTAQLINDDQDSPEQRVILGMQVGVAAVASAALAWIARANYARANNEVGSAE